MAGDRALGTRTPSQASLESGSRLASDGEEDSGPFDEGSGTCGLWAASVTRRSQHLSLLVVALAALTVLLGTWTAPALLSSQGWVPYEAPPGSVSEIAKERVDAYFPLLAMASRSQLVMVLRATDASAGGAGVLTEAVKNFSLGVERAMNTDSRTRPLDPIVTGYYVGNARLGVKPEDPVLRSGYVSSDGQMTLLVFMATRTPDPALHLEPLQVRDNVVDFLSEVAARAPEGVEAVVTGDPAISKDALNDHSIEQMGMAEIVTLPLAMVVLAVLLEDVRLLLIPPTTLLVTLAAAASLTLGALNVTGMRNSLSSDIPPVMCSVVMALSLDYCLFMLARFNENRGRAMTLQENVTQMLWHTGHTICVSGSLIAIAFFGAYTIPERNLQTAGVALGVTTCACVLVSVLLVPALLLILGRVLTLPICGSSGRSVGYKAGRTGRLVGADAPHRASAAAAATAADTGAGAGAGAGNSAPVATSVNWSARGWLWLALRVARHPHRAAGLVLLLCLPLLLQLPRLHATADSYAMLPGDLQSIRGLRLMAEGGFPVGRFEPYTVVVSTDRPLQLDYDSADTATVGGLPSALLTRDGFDALLSLCRSLRESGDVASMLGPVWMIDEAIDYSRAAQKLHPSPNSSAHDRQMDKLYRAVVVSHTTTQAALMQIHTSLLPRGSGAADWVAQARRRLEAWAKLHPHYTVTISGGASTALDIRRVVLEYMPTYVGYISFGVMAITIILFKSLILPFRLVFALLFTLCATFGVAIIVYQSSLLHAWNPNLKNYYGLTYESLPVATCIGIALGLDYDIFLISRIVEYRMDGHSDREAIIKGVARTGGVISGVGLIMSLAFSGLMFASKLMLQQMGVLLVTSVLLDTFVVRTVLVPALMLSAGEGWNWWPMSMPEPTPSASARLNGDPSSKLSASSSHPLLETVEEAAGEGIAGAAGARRTGPAEGKEGQPYVAVDNGHV